MLLRAILLDHDGTFVNSEPIHYKMWAQVLRNYGLSLSELQYKDQYAGVPTRTNAIDLVQRFGIDKPPGELAEAKNAATRDYLAQQAFPLMPGVREAVSYFYNAGLKLAVVTGAGPNSVQATLRANGFEKYFSTIVSGDDVRASKPAPDCYLLALERLGIAATECLAIEDTQHGLQAASQAGIRCVALPTEMSEHQDFHLAAEVFGGMSEAVGYVRQILCAPQ